MPTKAVDGGVVHYVEAGAGEPIVLLHASSSSAAQWRGLCHELEAEFKTVAIDLWGHGGTSAWENSRAYDLHDDIKLVNAIGDRPFHLVGHSHGGNVALATALARPGMLRSLVLIEPVAFWLLELAREDALLAEIRDIADNFRGEYDRGNVEAAVAPYIDYWGGEGTWTTLPEKLRDYALATAGQVYVQWPPAFERQATLDDLRGLNVPTLVLAGGATRPTTARIAEILGDTIPGARREIIADAPHMSPLTHPEPVNRAIRAHLGRHAG